MLTIESAKGKDSVGRAHQSHHRLAKMQHTKFGEPTNDAGGTMNAA
jgi:hypothetical protein